MRLTIVFIISSFLLITFSSCGVRRNPTFGSSVRLKDKTKETPFAYSDMRPFRAAKKARGYNVKKGAPRSKSVKMKRGYNIYSKGPKVKRVKHKRGYNIYKNAPKIRLIRPSTDYVGPMDRAIKPPRKRQRNVIMIQKPKKVKQKKNCDANTKPKKSKPKYSNDANIWH